MPYIAEISRGNPACFLFLIDQSGSMADVFATGESKRRKSEGVADAINRLLQNLVIKCAKEEGVRDYFQVGVVGYGATVGPAFTGPLAGRELVPIREIAEFPGRIEERKRKADDGAGGLVEQSVRFPIWFDAVANGGTPMCEALRQADATVQSWIVQYPNSFPPIIINITDGELTDGDPTDIAESIKKRCTSDGEAMMFNAHISSAAGAPVEFPSSEVGLPDKFAQLLFQMSSVLPPHLRDQATREGYNVTESSRAFVFNADLVSIIRFLDIGTRPSNLR